MDYFKLGAVLTLKDMLSEKMQGVKGKFDDLRKKLKESGDDLANFEKQMKNLKIGAAMAGSGLILAGGLLAARVESSKLEANIRSLGVTAAETDKIAQSTRIMAAEYGLAKETFLGGIYDIKSAVSSLDPGQLAGITEQVARLAIATKGDFGGLSDLFGTTHAQFKRMYKDLSDEKFAELFGNTITYAANVYKTDGAKMQQAMQALGASGASLGITLEEQSAVLGRLQNTMLAGVAGTSFRAFLSNVGEGFQKLGLQATDAKGKLKSVPDLLAQIQKKFGTELDVKEMEQMKKAFGTEEALSFVKELLPNFKDLKDEIQTIKDLNAKGDFGFVDFSAKENMKSLATQIDRLSSGWKAFKDLIASGFGDSFIAPLAGKIADLFVWIQKAAAESPALKSLLSNLGGAAVGVTVIGGAILAFSAGIRIYNTVLAVAGIRTGLFAAAHRMLNAVMSVNPIIAVITAVTLLIIYWDQFKNMMVRGWEIIKYKWETAPGWLRGVVSVLMAPIFALIWPIKMLVQHWSTVVDFMSAAWNRISAVFDTPLKYILTALFPFISIPILIIKNWDKLTEFFRKIWEGLKPIFERIGGFFEWLADTGPATPTEKLSNDIRKTNRALDELREKQQLLKAAGQTNLPEYQELTRQVKLQSDSLSVLKKQEMERGQLAANVHLMQQKVGNLQAALPLAKGPGKAIIEEQINAMNLLKGKLQGALDAGDLNLAKKFGDKSLLNEIENKGISLAKTFAEGMKKGKNYTDAEIKDMVGSIVRFLPASDAKQGPLSRLTASGRALVSTFNKGVEVEGRNTDATERFVQRQSRIIKTDSPLMQKITEGAQGARLAANAMIGNVYLTLSGKNLSREEFARQLSEELLDILDKAEPA